MTDLAASLNQNLDLFQNGGIAPPMPMEVTSQLDIESLIAANSPVVMNTSGGKDSCAAAVAACDYLNRRGHAGQRLLIHADLGSVEWEESLPTCERLAKFLGIELVVVRRARGGMMERWEQRWADNVRRYSELSTVTLILPFSTPRMRFCTSELKGQVIDAYVKSRFPGDKVISVTGVRRQESSSRAKTRIAERDVRKKIQNRKGYELWHWRPIADWSVADVMSYLRSVNPDLIHEAYTRFGMTRVSCCACILGSLPDLVASSKVPHHRQVYRQIMSLEMRSTFGFQGSRWLSDVAPQLLSVDELTLAGEAKRRGAMRQAVEKEIPPGLLYTQGWPTRMISRAEAGLLGAVRSQVSELVGLSIGFVDPGEILGRWEQLLADRNQEA